jgi:hypothetical protein
MSFAYPVAAWARAVRVVQRGGAGQEPCLLQVRFGHLDAASVEQRSQPLFELWVDERL